MMHSSTFFFAIFPCCISLSLFLSLSFSLLSKPKSGDPNANSGAGAENWGLWRKDPGPRGVRLYNYDKHLGHMPWLVLKGAVFWCFLLNILAARSYKFTDFGGNGIWICVGAMCFFKFWVAKLKIFETTIGNNIFEATILKHFCVSVYLFCYQPQRFCFGAVPRLKQRGGRTPAQWQFDEKDWWLEEIWGTWVLGLFKVIFFYFPTIYIYI